MLVVVPQFVAAPLADNTLPLAENTVVAPTINKPKEASIVNEQEVNDSRINETPLSNA
jgi:hypothetical protein